MNQQIPLTDDEVALWNEPGEAGEAYRAEVRLAAARSANDGRVVEIVALNDLVVLDRILADDHDVMGALIEAELTASENEGRRPAWTGDVGDEPGGSVQWAREKLAAVRREALAEARMGR